MPKLDLQPVRRADLKIGAPLPFAIYDANQRLLLGAGEMLFSEAQLERLLSSSIFREQDTELARSLAPPVIAPRPPGSSPRAPRDARRTDAAVVDAPLSRFKLTPGQLLQVDFLASANRPRAALTLIGLCAPYSVLLSATNTNGMVLGFHEGMPLFVKAMVGNDLISFDAAVTKVCFVPYPYLHLAYPPLVQMQRLRRHARIPTRLIATATNLTRGAPAGSPCRITNMSTGGLRVDGAAGIAERGELLRIAFKLPAAGEDYVLAIDATVRSLGSGESAGEAHYGLQYERLSPPDRLVIENYVMGQLIGA